MQTGARRAGAMAMLLSQVTNSASNGLLVVLVARVASPEDLGKFSIVLGIWLFLVGSFRAVISQPLLIAKRSQGRDLRSGAHRVVWLYLVAASVGTLALQLTEATRSLVWLPAFFPLATGLALAQDACRFSAFGASQPARALRSDAAWLLAQVALLAAMSSGGLTIAEITVAWGAGAAVGLLTVLDEFAPVPGRELPGPALRELWRRGRFIGIGVAVGMLAASLSPVLLAFAGSLAVAGAFRVVDTMVQPIRVAGLALETDLLSAGYARRRAAVAVISSGLILLSGIAIAAAPYISDAVFGSDVVADRITVGAAFLATVLYTLSLWPRSELKLWGRERHFAVVRSFGALVYLGALGAGAAWGGVRGAAIGIAITGGAELWVTYLVARHANRRRRRAVGAAVSPVSS